MAKPARGKRGGRSALRGGGHAQRGRGQRRYDDPRPSSALGGLERPDSAVDDDDESGEGSGSDTGEYHRREEYRWAS